MQTQVQIKDCLNLLLLSLGPKNKKTQLQRNHPQWQKHVWARKFKQTSLALLAHANIFCVAFLAHLYVHSYPCLNPSTISFCWCHPKLNLFEDLLVVGAVEGLFPTQQNVPAEAGRKFQVVHQIDCLKFTWQKVATSSHIIWLPWNDIGIWAILWSFFCCHWKTNIVKHQQNQHKHGMLLQKDFWGCLDSNWTWALCLIVVGGIAFF